VQHSKANLTNIIYPPSHHLSYHEEVMYAATFCGRIRINLAFIHFQVFRFQCYTFLSTGILKASLSLAK